MTQYGLVYQFIEPTWKFIVMMNAGLSLLAKRRPIDALNAALQAMDGNTGSIVHFRDRQVLPYLIYGTHHNPHKIYPKFFIPHSYGQDQTCAMSLAIAAGNTLRLNLFLLLSRSRTASEVSESTRVHSFRVI